MSHVVPESATPPETVTMPRGQVLVIFAFLLTILLGMSAFVVDLAWIWSNQLQVQRAADAGALAGVVHLPGNPNAGVAAARAESRKNGFEHNVNGVVVTANPDPAFARRMIVNVSTPVDTFFLSLFGFDEVNVDRTAKAEYVLPVPMGSPENYYGVFGLTRGLTSTEDVTVTSNSTTTDWSCGSGNSLERQQRLRRSRAHHRAGRRRTGPSTSGTLANALGSNNNAYARTTREQRRAAMVAASTPSPGCQRPEPARRCPSRASRSACRMPSSTAPARARASRSSCRGTTAPTGRPLVNVPTSGEPRRRRTAPTMSSAAQRRRAPGAAIPGCGTISATRTSEFASPRSEGCSGTRTFSVDMLDVRVTWDYTVPVTTTTTVTTNLPDVNLKGPGTACTSGKAQCYEANGVALNPRGFWGTLNTQGAENVNGDAYQANYDTRTGGVSPNCSSVTVDNRACYDPNNYYNYAIEMPAGTTGGSVYVYDPGFCDVDPRRGTGDRWFGGDAPVSTFYTLYNTQGTLSEIGDDGAPIAQSNSQFRGMDADDSTMAGNGGANECQYLVNDTYGDGRDYHSRWYLLASGLTGGANGTIYRLHTTSTDPASPANQLGTNGANSFAIYASASGGAPKVYGIGAMQAFTPLSSTGSTVQSEFYLAQIEAVHAGKTVEIHLWDPGDTSPLNAQLQILVPNAAGWSPTSFTYTGTKGTTNTGAANCNGASGSGTAVTTNVGSTVGTFNGCWLVIQAVIPANYTAPQDGWWKIRYLMTGNGASDDVTTWTVNIIGNPVHLILPN